MKWKGRRQSKNIEEDIEYGKNFNPVGFMDHEAGQKAIEERAKRDWLRDTAGVNGPKGPFYKDRKAAKELDDLQEKGKTPTPTPRVEKIQVTPGKWKSK